MAICTPESRRAHEIVTPPAGSTSKERYAWIAENLEAAVEEAIQIRKNN